MAERIAEIKRRHLAQVDKELDVDRLIDGMMDYGRQFLGRPQYEEEPLDNRRGGWRDQMDEVPNNLIQYPTRRSEYMGRRAAGQ